MKLSSSFFVSAVSLNVLGVALNCSTMHRNHSVTISQVFDFTFTDPPLPSSRGCAADRRICMFVFHYRAAKQTGVVLFFFFFLMFFMWHYSVIGQGPRFFFKLEGIFLILYFLFFLYFFLHTHTISDHKTLTCMCIIYSRT